MTKELYEEKIRDGIKMAELFAELSDTEKIMAIVYISALRDREIADQNEMREDDWK